MSYVSWATSLSWVHTSHAVTVTPSLIPRPLMSLGMRMSFFLRRPNTITHAHTHTPYPGMKMQSFPQINRALMPPTQELTTLVNNPLQVKSQMRALTQTSLVVFICCTCTNFYQWKWQRIIALVLNSLDGIAKPSNSNKKVKKNSPKSERDLGIACTSYATSQASSKYHTATSKHWNGTPPATSSDTPSLCILVATMGKCKEINNSN